MHTMEISSWGKYRVLVGGHTVGIIPPSRHQHIVPISEVKADGQLTVNGTSDGRVSPDDIAAYIVRNKIR